MNKKTIIVGPSHIVRWEHQHRTGGLPQLFESPVFIGGGGLPVWNESLIKRTRQVYTEGSHVYLLVGDIRFGNNIPQDQLESEIIFHDGYRNVHKSHISPQKDALLFEKTLRALEHWSGEFKNITIILWTQWLREVVDRSSGRHVFADNAYKNPLFDIKRMEKSCTLASCIPKFSIDSNIEILKTLVVDGSLHPSPLGYFFLYELISNQAPAVALRSAQRHLKNMVWASMSPGSSEPLICGDSIFIDHLHHLLVATDSHTKYSFKLLSRGAHLREIREAASAASEVWYFSGTCGSANSEAQMRWSKEYEEIFSLMPEKKIHYTPWEHLGHHIISLRHPDLQRLADPDPVKLEKILRDLSSIHLHDLSCADSLFDLGEETAPTLKGIIEVLKLINQKDKN